MERAAGARHSEQPATPGDVVHSGTSPAGGVPGVIGGGWLRLLCSVLGRSPPDRPVGVPPCPRCPRPPHEGPLRPAGSGHPPRGHASPVPRDSLPRTRRAGRRSWWRTTAPFFASWRGGSGIPRRRRTCCRRPSRAAWSSCPSSATRRPRVAWFYRVLRNAVIDRYRRQGAASRGLEVARAGAGERPRAPPPDVRDAACALHPPAGRHAQARVLRGPPVASSSMASRSASSPPSRASRPTTPRSAPTARARRSGARSSPPAAPARRTAASTARVVPQRIDEPLERVDCSITARDHGRPVHRAVHTLGGRDETCLRARASVVLTSQPQGEPHRRGARPPPARAGSRPGSPPRSARGRPRCHRRAPRPARRSRDSRRRG